jgi:hypothetical protein
VNESACDRGAAMATKTIASIIHNEFAFSPFLGASLSKTGRNAVTWCVAHAGGTTIRCQQLKRVPSVLVLERPSPISYRLSIKFGISIANRVKVASHDGITTNHRETEYRSITHSHVPSFWRRATSEVTVPLRLRVEVRARSPQMSAGRCYPNPNFRFSGPNPVTWNLVKNS